MDITFMVTDKTGRRITLSRERWKHIVQKHPGIGNINEIIRALQYPAIIKKSKYDPDNTVSYFSYNKMKRCFLHVAVKYLNGEGFVITAYNMRKIS